MRFDIREFVDRKCSYQGGSHPKKSAHHAFDVVEVDVGLGQFVRVGLYDIDQGAIQGLGFRIA